MIEKFLILTPAGQVNYLKTDEFAAMEREQRIAFLKEIAISEKISSKCLASALKILRELKFRDRAFYKGFLNHPDSSVTTACKKALSEKGVDMGFGFFPMRELVRKQNNEQKLQTVKLIVSETGQAGEELLLTFLAEDNMRVREVVVRELSKRAQLDEGKLAGLLTHSLWYTRAAIVEILGSRRSKLLLDRAAELLNDPNVEVRLQLLTALSRFDRERVKDLVFKLTKDPHVRVSKEAQKIFSAI
jgi:HEAT repeat protein